MSLESRSGHNGANSSFDDVLPASKGKPPLAPRGKSPAQTDSPQSKAAPPHKPGAWGSWHKNAPHHKRGMSFDSLQDLSAPIPLVPLVRRVVGEGFMLAGLAVQLLAYLGLGWKWAVNLFRLVLYATLLLPGFLQIVAYYFTSPRVIRSIPYGRMPRQRLDVYYPPGLLASPQKTVYPVVIFVTGGAWTIGYKAWGALLAKRLSDAGVVVACLDYRNFPQRIITHKGDPDNIVLVGQSAGGHLGALALIRQAEQTASGKDTVGAFPAWNTSDIRAFVGVSGAYDLDGLAEHLHQRGLYKSMFGKIMSIDGVPSLTALSPLAAAQGLAEGVFRVMPRWILIHGTSDKSVPCEGTVEMNKALKAAGVACECHMVPGKTHTSFILEGPMCGGRDMLTETVLSTVQEKVFPYSYPFLCPRFLCDLAGQVCPF
ncbi:MAG: hypothetical protein WDW38_001019 [Sanguina aurantia]